jgi:hypothetical protein
LTTFRSNVPMLSRHFKSGDDDRERERERERERCRHDGPQNAARGVE